MLTRKSSILLATCGGLSSIHAPGSVAGSSTSPWSGRESTRQRQRNQKKHHRHATTVGNDEANHARREQDQPTWPTAPKGAAHPTPYQILAMRHNAIYTKARFHELVKLYHPDRTGSSSACDAIPYTVRIERYRLIVAAHTILSDPVKRSAYDRFGAGWNGKAEVGGQTTYRQQSPYGKPGPFSNGWERPDDPIWQNATWEDWERFYARRAREAGGAGDSESGAANHQARQGPLYFQNSYFVVLVMILALAGSSANYSRARDAGTYFVAQRDLVHDQAAKDLRRVRQEASSGGRDERIQWFVRNREATLGLTGSDTETLREEKIDRLLPEREVCRSEEVAEKDI